MSKSITEIARHPTRFGVILGLALLALVVGLLNASATPASNFMETAGAPAPAGTPDGNVRDNNDSTNPPFDWGNSGDGTPTNTCPTSATGFTTVNLSGGGGLFNCGQFKNSTTTPIAPIPTANGTVGTNNIAAASFFVDPESTDVGNCSPSPSGSTTASPPGSTTCPAGPPAQVLCSGTVDPTVYTGAGGEKNGDPLNGKGVETFAASGVPGKDELTNVYALARKPTSGTDPNEVFFGGDRVINNGESHIDFEFLQSAVNLVVTSPCSPSNEGHFDGHRAQGDFIASIEYTKGGSLGGFELNQWHCLADTHSADSGSGWVSSGTQSVQGTTCDDSTAHYQLMACVALPGASACPPIDLSALPGGGAGFTDAIRAVTNSAGAVPCGGWVCRDGNGNSVANIDTNELMEGSVNLASIGFTGCISTFIPHTRTSQSFTSTLKDFAMVPFNTCRPSTSLSLSTSPTPNAGSDILVHKGDSVTFTFTETNDSSLGTPALLNPSVTMSSSPSGATCTPLKTGGDTNNDGKLDRGEAWTFACSVTFNTAGSFTIKGTAHGTFNGSDVTFCADPNNPPSGTICDQDEQVQIVVRVISPSTALTKSASPTTVRANLDTVTYTYRESNDSTGGNGTTDLDLTSVSVTDDKCSPLARGTDDTGNNDNTLSVGETWVFTCAKTLAATTTNTATATGTDALGFTITFCTTAPNATTICDAQEQAQATVTVISPAMSVAKSAAPVVTATYSYGETNSGNVILTNPSVSDDKCSPVVQDTHLVGGVQRNTGDTNNDGKFDPNETWNFKCTATITLLNGTGNVSVQNTATATATDPLGNTLTQTDKLTVNATISVTHP